ncbi:hypothetical protein DRE_07189 [Drechslerella stenobrocha 248]|uniref:Rad4 beta-hairpin domain-containing protein n=1 Tax=Drechslerella stenobrocha 248 TaxID=1043628 RepID=W7HVQ2_9PEZI|nr:hypothetical protein DRE_07189 [Drechslerella stenobrocha 248]
MAKKNRQPAGSEQLPQTSQTHLATSEEHDRKRRRIERGFRRVLGHPVSDHSSDEESQSTPSSTNDVDCASDQEASITRHRHESRTYKANGDSGDDANDQDDGDWENIFEADTSHKSSRPLSRPSDNVSARYGDLTLTLGGNSVGPVHALKRKGVSAWERTERLHTHVMHVICLLYHGFLRNVWMNDKELQRILLDVVAGTGVKKDIGFYLAQNNPSGSSKSVDGITAGQEKKRRRKQQGGPPLSDPQLVPTQVTSPSDSDAKLLELLSDLMQLWMRRFRVTAPGLRKKGYRGIGSEAPKTEGEETPEKICGLEEFRREQAEGLHGSRDVGAQLFTALLRALGLEARLVFSLCPLGYGFTKAENCDAQDLASRGGSTSTGAVLGAGESDHGTDLDSDDTSTSPRSRAQSRKIQYDQDLKFPTFWTEVYSPVTQKWIAIDVFATGMILSKDDDMYRLEPKGQAASKTRQQISYVIAYNMNNTARDVTVRYLTRKLFPGKTRGFRMPEFDREIFNDRGELLMVEKYDLFSQRILKCFQASNPENLARDLKEDQELCSMDLSRTGRTLKEGFPTSATAYKNHPKYILERHLKREECILPGELPLHSLTIGKGDIAKEESVYSRQAVVTGKPAENWYREGRVVKPNETPLKQVATRAVTVNRKRAVEIAKREGDEGAGLVGLYALYQTELYRPPPIFNGVIPTNAYGNIDYFVPSMLPEGAAHVPYKNAARLCKRLGISYAEAITGFEFGNKRAIPRAEGVLCAEDAAEVLTEACRQDEQQTRLKEEGKREKLCLGLWKKFLIGLRIVDNVEKNYGSNVSGVEHTAVHEPTPKKDRAMGDMPEEQMVNDRERNEICGDSRIDGTTGQISHRQASLDTELAGGFFPE